jgi:hypothetical protein
VTRHVCPECGRSISDTGAVYWSVGPERRAYVILRPHKRPEGERCPATTATVIAHRS